MKTFNINNYVSFKPTDYGKDVYKKHYEKYGLELGDGICKMQMHEFMHVFDDKAFTGNSNFIKNNEIHFDEEDLK